MKTMPPRMAMVGLALALFCAPPTYADSDDTKTFKGLATLVDHQEHYLNVKLLGMTRTFDFAPDCKFTMESKPNASLQDLRPGQNVEVTYVTANGVQVAKAIHQQNMTLSGSITAVDAKNHKLTIKNLTLDREFTLHDDCVVELRGGKAATPADLKAGQLVTVVYEEPAERLIAHRVQQKVETFTGMIRAIDTSANTVKARYLFMEKKFSLAKDCKIMVPGRPDASLSDLRIGEKVTFHYETVEGVLIANRIVREPDAPTVSSVN